MLNGESQNKASKNKGNNIVHVRAGNIICRGNSEEREEEERRHCGNWHNIAVTGIGMASVSHQANTQASTANIFRLAMVLKGGARRMDKFLDVRTWNRF
ncbi:hypothetical protein ACFX1R_006424 [Malus domestica]